MEFIKIPPDVEIHNFLKLNDVEFLTRNQFEKLKPNVSNDIIEQVTTDSTGLCFAEFKIGSKQKITNVNKVDEKLRYFQKKQYLKKDYDVVFIITKHVQSNSYTVHTVLIVKYAHCKHDMKYNYKNQYKYTLDFICSQKKGNTSFAKLLMYIYIYSLNEKGESYGALDLAFGDKNIGAKKLYKQFKFQEATSFHFNCFDGDPYDKNSMYVDVRNADMTELKRIALHKKRHSKTKSKSKSKSKDISQNEKDRSQFEKEKKEFENEKKEFRKEKKEFYEEKNKLRIEWKEFYNEKAKFEKEKQQLVDDKNKFFMEKRQFDIRKENQDNDMPKLKPSPVKKKPLKWANPVNMRPWLYDVKINKRPKIRKTRKKSSQDKRESLLVESIDSIESSSKRYQGYQ